MKNSETITKINPYSSKRVLVFGASLSANSINQVFAEYAASRLQGVQTTLIKFSDYANNLPIFTPEELQKGIPEQVVQFGKLLDEHDAVIVSLAENNFTYTAAFKNLLDWLSREKNLPNYYAQTFRGKQFFLLKASPAPDYGTPSTVKHAAQWFPLLGAQIASTYVQFDYYQKFVNGSFTDEAQKQQFEQALAKFQAVLN